MKDRGEILPEDIIGIVNKMIVEGKITKKRIDISYQRIIKFKEGL